MGKDYFLPSNEIKDIDISSLLVLVKIIENILYFLGYSVLATFLFTRNLIYILILNVFIYTERKIIKSHIKKLDFKTNKTR